MVSGGSVLVLGGLAARAARARHRARARGRLFPAGSATPTSWAPPTTGATPASPPHRITGGAAALRSAPAVLVSALEAAGVAADPGRCWQAWRWSVAAATAAAGLLVGPGAGLVGLAVSASGPALLLAALKGRGAVRLEASLAELLEAIARALRSGASLRQAVASAAAAGSGPVARDLAQVMVDVDRGADFGAEVAAWGQRRPLPSLRLAVAALTLAAETGGAQARALDRVATTVRDRLAVRSEQAALGSQARASALVMGVTPVAFAVLAGVTDPHTADFLLHRTPGLVCLTLGLLLDAAALIWMLRITGADS